MNDFGETLRTLRVAQEMGLRETAREVGISPAYLSRIERGKEHPPQPAVIKELARVLAADPDVLFRLSASTDPDITLMLKDRPTMLELIRVVMAHELSDSDLKRVIHFIERDVVVTAP
jgi:transcriptional regulator with XRE-family HTH domain